MVSPVNDSSKVDVLRNDRIKPEISLNRGSDAAPACDFREGSTSNYERIRFNDFVFDFQRGSLTCRGQEIALRPKTYEVLRYLVSNSGRLVPKDELMKAVWPEVIVTDDSLFQCIAELRRALEGEGQRLITTIQRRGYRFEADLSRPPDTTSYPDVDVSRSLPAQEELPQNGERIPRRKRLMGMGTLAAVVITVAALVIHKWWLTGGVQSISGTPISLVVLPFRSLGDDHQSDIFAAGLTVELTTDLSKLPGAVVISPATAHAINDPAVDIRQIGRDLDVRYVVQGTVARSGKDIRINTQLIEAATGRHVWADRQMRESGQVSSWQDEVVGGIASALNFKLTRLESERTLRERPHYPEVYDLTIRGWALVYTAKKPENYQSALLLFKEALSRDAKMVNALAGVAWVSMLSVLNVWSQSPESDLATAKSAVDRLLAIDPNHVVALHVRGLYLRFEKNTDAAKEAFITAVSVNPNFANSHAQLGTTHMELGYPEEGIRSLERAMRLSPRDPNAGHWMASMGIAYLHLERYTEAVTWMSRSHDVATSSPTLLHRAYLVSALALAGRTDDARAALRALQSIRPDATITSFKRISRSTNPMFMKQRERLYDGLRLAGLSE